MRDLPGFETNYETAARFYRKNGELSFVCSDRFIFKENAILDARDWLREQPYDLNPCNISVRGPNGRFVKWKH